MKASVIIPAYNAMTLIEGAIRSLTETPPSFDYEIVVVDDGSTDDTLALLRGLSEEFPVLRIYQQENAGPAAARNLGIEKARGEYILFCDSDDVFVPGALQRAVDLAQEEDLLVFGYYLVQEGERRAYRVADEVLSSPETWREALPRLYGANMLNQVWGKVFSSRLIRENNIRFPSLFWGEDRLFLFQVLREAKRVKVSGECLYDYVQQKNSLISRFVPEKPRICQQIHREICALAQEKGGGDPTGEEIFGYMYLKSLLSSLTTLYSPSCSLVGREKRAVCRAILAQPEIGEVKSFPPDCGRAFRILGGALRGGECYSKSAFCPRGCSGIKNFSGALSQGKACLQQRVTTKRRHFFKRLILRTFSEEISPVFHRGKVPPLVIKYKNEDKFSVKEQNCKTKIFPL